MAKKRHDLPTISELTAPRGYRYENKYDTVNKRSVAVLVRVDETISDSNMENNGWKGNVLSLADLQSLPSDTISDNDIRFVEESGNLYIYDTTNVSTPSSDILIPYDLPAKGRWKIFIGSGSGSGAQGPTGPQGFDGPTGPQGLAGLQGSQGVQGPQGVQGVAGPAGIQGTSGPTGPQGNIGATGPQGVVGPTGSNGSAGATGIAGSKTIQGSSVPTSGVGVDGDWYLQVSGIPGAMYLRISGVWVYQFNIMGPQGVQGIQGAAGLQGNQGPLGLTGPSGPTGPQGLAGATGPSGSSGATGLAGATGPQGIQGALGPVGATGPQGQQGIQGTAGVAGATGADGVSNVPGPAGVAGPTGPTGADGVSNVPGPAGADGADGATGPQGPAGPTGADGVSNVPGPAGADGADGATGPQGPAGATGSAGANGTPGTNGATGSQGIQGVAGPTGADGATGPQGPAGSGSGSGVSWNNTSRYRVTQTLGINTFESIFTTSATVTSGLSWTRSGSSLTIINIGHGRSTGDRVIVRNVNVDNLVGTIAVLDLDTFTVTTPNSGATSGADGAYSLGCSYSLDGSMGSLTGFRIEAPANSDIQIQSFRLHLLPNSRAGTTMTMTVPTGTTTGGAYILAGGNSTNSSPMDIIVPLQTVRSDSDATTAVPATLSKNNSPNLPANPAAFVFGNLGAVGNGVIIVLQF